LNLALSKSTFIRGYQCPKALYLQKNYPELRDEVSVMQKAVFNRGTEVGILARQLFPGGINASPNLPDNFKEAIRYTGELIDQDFPVIYEAGFTYDDVHCFVDILVREDTGWHAYEVKSSTNLSNIYHLDAALQYYIMRSCSLPLNGIDIIHLNNKYVRHGPLLLQDLFTSHSVTRHAERLEAKVREKIDELKALLLNPGIPQADIGPHCTDPYTCDFMGHCWQGIPDNSIFEVSGLIGRKKWDLYRMGIHRLEDIPDDFPLSPSQRLQLTAAITGKGVWKKKEIRNFVRTFQYPLYFIDFESFQPPVPLFDNSRPYQQIPFQYSLHIVGKEQSIPLHKEFLAEAGPDPRPVFAERLLADIGDSGDVVVYNKAFENRVLQDISRDFPVYSERMEQIIYRTKDLMEPFRQKLIYLPEMRGSYSIKNVYPAIVPGSGYDNLDIADGGSASLAYESLFHPMGNIEIEEIRKQLLEYCSMDTLAMVKIWHILNAS
jgi:hypothetical protein